MRELKKVSFHYEGGIIAVEYLNKNRAALFSPPIYISGKRGPTPWKLPFNITIPMLRCIFLANNIDTHEGGTHLSGFRAAITRVLNDYGRKYNYIKQNEPNLSGEDTGRSHGYHKREAYGAPIRRPNQNKTR